MACVNPDGTLSGSGLTLLRALLRPAAVEEVARRTGRPLFQVRSGLRELVAAGLVSADGAGYQLTDRGRERLGAG